MERPIEHPIDELTKPQAKKNWNEFSYSVNVTAAIISAQFRHVVENWKLKITFFTDNGRNSLPTGFGQIESMK